MLKIIIFLVLIVGIFTGVYLVTSGNLKLFSKASESQHNYFPKKVIITNVTGHLLTLSYYTPDKPVETKVSFGEHSNSLDKSLGDDRDGGAIINVRRYTHYITLNNLEPNTNYFIKIENTDGSFPEESFVQAKTGPVLSEGTEEETSPNYKGQVVNQFGRAPTDTILYFKTENGQLLSSLISGSGEWNFNLKGYRNKGFNNHLNLARTDLIEILALSGLDGLSYLKIYEFGKDKSHRLILEQDRIPFYKIQLGPILGYGGSDPAPQSDGVSKPRSFFDIVWEYFKSFFAI